MITIFFALSQEISCLKPKVNIIKKTRHANALVYQSEFYGFPLTLVQTGMGKNVPEIIKYLSKHLRIQLMVSSGFAGSVKQTVEIGDLVIGKHVLYSSQKTFGRNIKIESALTCDRPFVDLAIKQSSTANIKAHCGDILTVNNIIAQSSTKKQIGDATSAIAIDMESYTIAEQANMMGIPFIVIRSISDGVNEDVEVNENMVTNHGNVNVSATMLHLLKKPHKIPNLNRLRKQTKHAKSSLSAFFPDFITQVYNTLLT
jgi:adenosylhomocysteine nucleosidase